ncbi:Aste57867_611 [Aphanomyces stellatus]|uniref:Aste57867_611 protein n=1 Tax=Aphanomyces stellatus TaxID=120398 RepID=A0A485K422_9STRA|nr:hypothetical protein As57867_000610 [Aphanomyces stellatus]VFT77836.1 Aste57867_611 [Aphanomyces stellatus]
MFKPLRFFLYYDNMTMGLLPGNQSLFIQEFVVPAAMKIWSNALAVVPARGNLFASAPCVLTLKGTTPPICSAISTTAASNQCVEQPIPATHFAPTRVCTTCRDATCSGASASCSTFGVGNSGIPNADMVMYIRANTTARCTPNVMAYAATCQRDQNDRPTFGTINFCPSYIDPSSTTGPGFERQVMTATHEFGHALGFSAASFALLRREDGTPRTPRVGGGQFGSTSPVTGICADSSTVTASSVPSNSTITYTTMRGHAISLLTTPTVLAAARAHFDCPSLPGVEIENGDPGACLGSHWEERLFGPDLMTPIVNYRTALSALTLAYFQDSGWYQANFTAAEPLYWGNNQGCPFTTDNCIRSTGRIPFWASKYEIESLNADTFCTTATEGCSADGMSRSQCSITSSTYTSPLPLDYQYFPGKPMVGGYIQLQTIETDAFGDYCPIHRAYAQGDCINPANLLVLPKHNVSPFGEIYGPTSRCTKMSLTRTNMFGLSVSNRFAGCYPMACTFHSKGPTIDITLATDIGSTVIVKCTLKGQEVPVPGFKGSLTCPDPFVICGLGHCSSCPSTSLCINGKCSPKESTIPAPTPPFPTPYPTTKPWTSVTVKPLPTKRPTSYRPPTNTPKMAPRSTL